MESFIETASGNRIAKSAEIRGSNRILISGNTTIQSKVELNGDTSTTGTSIQIGKFVFIDESTVLSPPKQDKVMKIGSFVLIGKRCSVKSSNIGNRVIIGDDCTISALTNIQDCVIIKSNTTIPNHLNIPPFSLVSMERGRLIIETLPESYKKLIESSSKLSYINNQLIPSEIP